MSGIWISPLECNVPRALSKRPTGVNDVPRMFTEMVMMWSSLKGWGRYLENLQGLTLIRVCLVPQYRVLK